MFMKSMNILFVHEVNYLAKPIFEIHEFPEQLALRGHKVSFIQFDEGYKFWQRKRTPKKQTISGRVYSKAKIALYNPIQLGIPGLDRVFAIFTFVPLLWRLLRRNSFDVIVQYAVPTYGVQTNWLAKANQTPVVFRALDVSHKIRRTPLAQLIKLAEKRVYAGATLISGNNLGISNYCQKMGLRTDKSITNFPPLDLGHFQGKIPDVALQKQLGILPEDKVITYMGSFFYFSGLADLIKSFAESHEPNMKLLIIGGGEQEKELRQLAKELRVQDKIIFTGFIDYSNLPNYFALSTVAVNPMLPSLVSNTALPQKVLQYVAAGLPVVSTKLEGIYKMFGEASGITWVSNSTDVAPAAMALAMDSNLANKNSKLQTKVVGAFLGTNISLKSFEETLKLAMVTKP